MPSGREAANLLATLDDPRFDAQTIHHAIEDWDRRGVRVERFHRAPDAVLAWIDWEFGGSWSSEVDAGAVWVARDDIGPVAFAAFDPRGLRFAWLAKWDERPEVGIFGPFGVAQRLRGTGLGALLLHAALFSLRERGYSEALIPVVAGERLLAYYERQAGARVVQRFDLVRLAGCHRATVLASGSGTNFQSVLDGARDGTLPLDVTALVCNRPDARAIERARTAGVATHVITWDRAAASRAEYDAAVVEAVARTSPDLVLLLGWMHVLPRAFVERFPATLNVHPAFLPLDATNDTVAMPDGSVIPVLRGARAVDDAFAAGVLWGGASVHRLGLEVDRGELMARAPLLRDPAEDRAAYTERLHALEHGVLGTAIRRWAYEQPGVLV